LLFTESEKKLDLYFNFIKKKDDILSLNNYTFGDFFLSFYSHCAWNKGYQATAVSPSHVDLHLTINNEGRLRTQEYDKRCIINVIYMYLHTLVSNTISISDDVRVIYH
jgi:hypothetical protein